MSEDTEADAHEAEPFDAERFRAEREQHRQNYRERYRQLVEDQLNEIPSAGAADAAENIIAAVFERGGGDDGGTCYCSCHPRLPDSDFHDGGFDCPCQRTPEERRAAWDEFRRSLDEFWASDEGQAIHAKSEAEEQALLIWLAAHPNVVVTSHGGMAPEQWEGSIDGRRFYFRERHDEWRIELDLRGTGRFVKVWTSADSEDEPEQLREIQQGDIVARGTIDDDGYGATPAERIQFIVNTVRTHIRREACRLHREDLAHLSGMLGSEPAWCPACGTQLSDLADAP
jgi:hypothetical protein